MKGSIVNFLTQFLCLFNINSKHLSATYHAPDMTDVCSYVYNNIYSFNAHGNI
jgi:hypothetical protein